MLRPTDGYGERRSGILERLLMRGALLGVTVVVIGALAGWTKRVKAADHVAPPDAGLVARKVGGLEQQLTGAQGELQLVKLQLERTSAILENSARYQIPADLAEDIYDIALSEGIDPALGFQLVKVESSFRATARSSMDAYGYTQLQLPTARFYHPDVTVGDLYDRETNLRIGFRFLRDLLEQFDHDMELALVAYNRGPGRVAGILATGGDPANGYAEAVMEGWDPVGTAGGGQ
ncbi:MAG TPA: transglycosylase SLT domain-containing protein [Gemmatimonadales bacterium]|nr:transglycosylase SLT domain-containing protein [Gemmatimonadales bacterium]